MYGKCRNLLRKPHCCQLTKNWALGTSADCQLTESELIYYENYKPQMNVQSTDEWSNEELKFIEIQGFHFILQLNILLLFIARYDCPVESQATSWKQLAILIGVVTLVLAAGIVGFRYYRQSLSKIPSRPTHQPEKVTYHNLSRLFQFQDEDKGKFGFNSISNATAMGAQVKLYTFTEFYFTQVTMLLSSNVES